MRRMDHGEIAFSVDVATADDGRALITPKGELDMATQGELRAALERAMAEHRIVTLDLGELRFLDTSGLRLILETAEASRRDGFAFTVRPGSEPVQRLFHVAGVAELVPFDPRT